MIHKLGIGGHITLKLLSSRALGRKQVVQSVWQGWFCSEERKALCMDYMDYR